MDEQKGSKEEDIEEEEGEKSIGTLSFSNRFLAE